MKHKLFVILLILAVVTGTFGPAGAQDDERFELTFLNVVWGNAPVKDSDFEKYLEDMFNIELEATWVPSNEWGNMVSLLMASDDLPVLTQVPEYGALFDSGQTLAVEDGVFKDLTPWLTADDFAEKYPHLAKIPQDIWDAYTYQGKLYTIPRYIEPWTFSGMYIRVDLFEKAGYTWPDDLPETMEELTDLILDLNEKYPDVYGLHVQQGLARTGEFANAFTGVQNWGVDEEGQFYFTNFTPEFVDYLKWLRTLYEAGAINPEFPLGQNNPDWANGKAALIMFRWHAYLPVSEEGQEEGICPPAGCFSAEAPEDAYTLPIPPVKGPKAWTVDANDGAWTKSMISANVPDEHIPRILEFIDYISSDEYADLVQWGAPDMGYYEIDEEGERVRLDKYEEDGVGSWGSFGHRDWGADPEDWFAYAIENHDTPEDVIEWTRDVVDKIYEAYEDSPGIRLPAYNLYSPSFAEYWGELTSRLTEMQVQFIFGEITEEEWNEYVESVTSDPLYQDIIDEFSEAYAEAQASE